MSKFLAGLCFVTIFSGCSTGPQLPITTPVVNVSCTWNLQDGGVADDCDCLIDRSSSEADAQTTGNEITTGDIEGEISPNVTP